MNLPPSEPGAGGAAGGAGGTGRGAALFERKPTKEEKLEGGNPDPNPSPNLQVAVVRDAVEVSNPPWRCRRPSAMRAKRSSSWMRQSLRLDGVRESRNGHSPSPRANGLTRRSHRGGVVGARLHGGAAALDFVLPPMYWPGVGVGRLRGSVAISPPEERGHA